MISGMTKGRARTLGHVKRMSEERGLLESQERNG
jgi:hypothetical protein